MPELMFIEMTEEGRGDVLWVALSQIAVLRRTNAPGTDRLRTDVILLNGEVLHVMETPEKIFSLAHQGRRP